MARSFVGRLAELATLRGTIDRARHSDGPTVALALGPAGSGKTRLLAETVIGWPRSGAAPQPPNSGTQQREPSSALSWAATAPATSLTD